MSFNKYKRWLQVDDYLISERTARRYKVTPTLSENFQVRNIDGARCSRADERVHITSRAENVTDQPISLENENASEDSPPSSNEYIQNYLKEYLSAETENNFDKKNYNDLQEFISSDEFAKKVITPVDKNVGEIFFMILKFSILNNLSVAGTTNLCKLINNLFEKPILPDSKYMIDKLLNRQCSMQFYAVCPNCSSYIGKFEEIKFVQRCDNCENDLDLTNPSNRSFFVIINPSTQISDLLHLHGGYYNEIVSKVRETVGCIKDIHDGDLYRKFVEILPEPDRHNYLTAILNTDGANRFKCSQYSIWPIYLMLNEIPIQERMNNLITCGLWFGNKKPDMCAFLDPFVDLINQLLTDRIHCTIKGESRSLQLHIISCCVDSVARASMQGLKQFNGNYGCGWCLHPGEYAERSMRYPLLSEPAEARDDEDTVNKMLEANPQDSNYGIMFPSPLINLATFKIISGFVPDYLHCCLEGVAAQLLEYYLLQMSDDSIKALDTILNGIAVPIQISRLTRPLSCRKDWKAREWENFVLYYSVPLLSKFLSRKLLNHWLFFVESLHTLLKIELHIDELNRVDAMLHEFVAKSEEYFTIKSMTFNMHQLLHLATSVYNFGPLWAHSTFSFESANRNLLEAIKCGKGVPQQIVRYVHIKHSTLVLEDYVYPKASDLVKYYCNNVLNAKSLNTKKISTITYFGKGRKPNDTIFNDLQLSANASIYYKIVKNNCLYESCVKFKRRSNNSFAQLKDSSYILIRGFIADSLTKKEITVCNIIKTRNAFNNNNYYQDLQVVEEIGDCKYIDTDAINIICIFMNVNGKQYICALPNLLHY